MPPTEAISSTSSAISDSDAQNAASDLKNMPANKLSNSFFDESDNNSGVMTRKQAKAVGLGWQTNIEMATGFKLQDAVLLNDCISSAAICSSCHLSTSKLQLYQNNDEREGLSESLFLKCTACGVVTPLCTSKRLGGIGGGSHEVNRRAVLSSYQFGHAGLKGMNLPPPLAKNAYNEHLKKNRTGINKECKRNHARCCQMVAGKDCKTTARQHRG